MHSDRSVRIQEREDATPTILKLVGEGKRTLLDKPAIHKDPADKPTLLLLKKLDVDDRTRLNHEVTLVEGVGSVAQKDPGDDRGRFLEGGFRSLRELGEGRYGCGLFRLGGLGEDILHERLERAKNPHKNILIHTTG